MFDDCLTLCSKLKDALASNHVDSVLHTMQTSPVKDAEQKAVIELCLNEALLDRVGQCGNVGAICEVVDMAIACVRSDLCTAPVVFSLLQSAFDVHPLEGCQQLFSSCLERRLEVWKSEAFYAPGKNTLLRMCNDLLKRLSRSQNTVFCGQIQLFLARLFPIDERSGINLTSQFNVDNVTVYETGPAAGAAATPNGVVSPNVADGDAVEDGELAVAKIHTADSVPSDSELYVQFWMLQDYFGRPFLCFERARWAKFVRSAETVFRVFESFKLDQVRLSSVDDAQSGAPMDAAPAPGSHHSYFAKYLTNPKLLDLQLNDSLCRRFVLVQFLVLFQYLLANVKFKTPEQRLDEKQKQWVVQGMDQVQQLIKDTPPDGAEFAEVVLHILNREENWNEWKNDGCPSFVRGAASGELFEQPLWGRAKRRSLDMYNIAVCVDGEPPAKRPKRPVLGTPELTRLWGLSADNLAACADPRRQFRPSLADFFTEAIEQLQPGANVDDQYKLVNDANYQWRALRLLSRQSSAFFNNRGPMELLKQYLERMLVDVAKELHMTLALPPATVKPPAATTTANAAAKGEPADKTNGDKSRGRARSASGGAPPDDDDTLSDTEHLRLYLDAIADRLGAKWELVAAHLGRKFFEQDEIDYIKDAHKQDFKKQAHHMLTLWLEAEREPSLRRLQSIFDAVRLDQLSAYVCSLEKVKRELMAS